MIQFEPKYITFDCYGTLTHFQMNDTVRPLIAASRKLVVIATRTHAGPVIPAYGYAGGGATLVGAGAIPASFLNAHKARLLLLVLLSLGRTPNEIRQVFEEGAF